MATKTKAHSSALADQLNATLVGGINDARLADELLQKANQDAAWGRAMDEVQKVRDFIGSPKNILGNESTKHGEIAEHVEVGVRRARDVLASASPSATMDGVGRTAGIDYQINGLDVQSKFINGSNNTLGHVIKHMGDYEDFGKDGSFYHIPKDQHDQILRVIKGDTDGLNSKSVRAILEKVEKIQQETGRPFEEVVRPSVSTYGEVQQGQVHDTLNSHEEDLKQQNDALKEQIAQEHQPSLSEGLRATAGAAAVGAAVGFASAAFAKYKEGKNIFKGEFTRKDWEEVGVQSLKGGAAGAVSGAALYMLTNCAELSAPFAGAFVTAVKGLAPLIQDYTAGKISLDTLIDEGMFVCSDVAIVGICTAVGQAVIPVPILGAVIGSIAGKVLSSCLGNKVRAAHAKIENRMKVALERLDDAFRKKVAAIEVKFDRLGALTKAAFDLSHNAKLLEASIHLAREYGVADSLLLKNETEVDAYFLT
ncbi:hypothetical protein [Massilia phyllosphaerae]|uniref:hypothetical protein n=1 Tax=Massilia phyllosphaerae TaxID=3106034 RepID=UPI002B1CB619|nr:hypothetical protein [Massilia sp. SGZ-792]